MNTKKVTEKDIIKNLIQENAPAVKELKYITNIGELKIKVYPVIPYQKRVEMIRYIVDGVFSGDKNTIDCYMPEFLGLVKRLATILYFTDFKLPKKIEDMWLTLRYTTIYEDVAKIIDGELQEIFDAAEDYINAYKEYLTNKTDIYNLISKIGNYAKDFTKDMPKLDLMNFDLSKLNEALKANGVNIDLNGILGSILKTQEQTDEK